MKSRTPSWSTRVGRKKIRRLYLNDAAGFLDSDLIQDGGERLFWRCRSILTVCEAAEGRVSCPACEAIIERRRDSKAKTIGCDRCGWLIRWADYQKSYQHRELYARGMALAAGTFMKRWPLPDPPRQKMGLIDRPIHVWHWGNSRLQAIGRPATVNLIEGSRRQVLELGDRLSRRGPTVPEGGI